MSPEDLVLCGSRGLAELVMPVLTPLGGLAAARIRAWPLWAPCGGCFVVGSLWLSAWGAGGVRVVVGSG